MTPLEEKLTRLFTPVVEDAGYRLVRVLMIGEAGGQVVQVMAENPQTRRIGADECAVLSRELAAVMDVEDPIQSAYRLEVSSPGIDRPLISLQDFIDFSGFDAKIEINPPLNGQKRFRGRISAAGSGTVKLETDEGPVDLPFSAIQKAKLVLTDELIKATASK